MIILADVAVCDGGAAFLLIMSEIDLRNYTIIIQFFFKTSNNILSPEKST